MKIYRNGELRASGSGHLPVSTTRTNHFIGRSAWGSDEYFDGMMDDIRVYDRAISIGEVNSIFKGDLLSESIIGGQDPEVSIFWGDEDAGQTTDVNSSSDNSWDNKLTWVYFRLANFLLF